MWAWLVTVYVRSDLRAPSQLCDVGVNTAEADCAISLLVVSCVDPCLGVVKLS